MQMQETVFSLMPTEQNLKPTIPDREFPSVLENPVVRFVQG